MSNKGKREQLGDLQVTSGEYLIKAATLKFEDHKPSAKPDGDFLISKEVKFHQSC